MRKGYVRVPIFIAPRRGADKMLGSFECDLKLTALVTTLRTKIAETIGCAAENVEMDGKRALTNSFSRLTHL